MTLPQSNPDPVRVSVTEREGPETPVRVQTIPWYQALAVRTLRTYLQALVGFLGAAFVLPGVLPDATGMLLGPYADRALVAAQLAALPAAMSLLQNALELLSKLDATNPGLRA